MIKHKKPILAANKNAPFEIVPLDHNMTQSTGDIDAVDSYNLTGGQYGNQSIQIRVAN